MAAPFTIGDAYRIAVRAHAGQVDKGGAPYLRRRPDPSLPSGMEPYQDGLIARAAVHDGARLVKVMDNAHNSLARRALGPLHLRTRHPQARAHLLTVEAAHRAGGGPTRDFPTDPDRFLAYLTEIDTRLGPETITPPDE